MKDPNSTTPETNDPLDQLWREADEHIADEGFTARLMMALPVRRRKRCRRTIILSVALVLCTGVAVCTLPSLGAILIAFQFGWNTRDLSILIALFPILAALGAMIWGVFALVRENG